MNPKIILYSAVSLDGFIADAAGGIDWLTPYNQIDFGEFAFDRFLANIGWCLMGRKTFDQVAGMGPWPHPEQQSFVWTSKPPSGSDLTAIPNVKFTSEHPAAVVSAILAANVSVKEGPTDSPKDIWLVGGGDLNRAFLEAQLIDELFLFYVPVFLGSGIPLWGKNPPATQWRTTGTAFFDKGVKLIRADRP